MSLVINNRVHNLVIHGVGFEATIDAVGNMVGMDCTTLQHTASLRARELLASSSEPYDSSNEDTDAYSSAGVVHVASVNGICRRKVEGNACEGEVQKPNDVEQDTELKIIRPFDEFWSFAASAAP